MRNIRKEISIIPQTYTPEFNKKIVRLHEGESPPKKGKEELKKVEIYWFIDQYQIKGIIDGREMEMRMELRDDLEARHVKYNQTGIRSIAEKTAADETD